jgi:hypothetical protein
VKTAQQIFTEAFALVRNPETWTQANYGEDAAGNECGWRSPDAVKFCSAGALCRVEESPGVHHSDAIEVRVALSRSMGILVRFNDTHTHAEVVAAWERAGKANGWLS